MYVCFDMTCDWSGCYVRLFARTVRLASHLHVCDGDLTVRKSDP